MLASVLTSDIAYISTNIDDIFVIMIPVAFAALGIYIILDSGLLG